jgi:SAM-dependent methyltransferase
VAPAAVAGRGPWRQRSAGLPLGLGDLAYVPRIPVTIPFEPGDAPQRQAAFREMYRVTKPGGRLLAADFNPSRRRSRSTPAGGGCAGLRPRSAR